MSSTQSPNIVIIHGFDKTNSTAKYVFEAWIGSEAKKTYLKTNIYSFDATRALIDEETGWNEIFNGFRIWLNKLYVPDLPASQPGATPQATTEEDQVNNSPTRPLLLLHMD
ncbi:hypothetical protein PG984_010098 [Apiospora sp. TS-2023a]